MMKFIFLLMAGGLIGVTSNYMFWMVSGLLSLLILLILGEVNLFMDQFVFSGGLMIDLLSFSLVVLSLFVTILMFFSSNTVYGSSSTTYFYGLIYFLAVVLVLTFIVNNFILFYFFFEISLVPTLLIILGWGYQPERLQAGVYFLFYTLGASLPLLLMLIYYFNLMGGLDLFIGFSLNFISSISVALFFFSIMAFMVKMPMYFTHLWLPKAHVEAPVSGSMILAGVLLKLGGYGIYRVFILLKMGLSNMSSYFFGLSIFGMVYVGFMCCRLNDMKGLVAYSSVAHMGMVICGVVTFSFWGFNGGLAMMVSHGICSSGLFCIVNMYYERSGSRSFYVNKGFLSLMPIFTMALFMLSGANMAAPPTINLFSEIFLMGSMMKFDLIMLMAFPLGSYLGAVFTLFLFSYSQHGKFFEGSSFGSMATFREYFLLVSHIVPINFLILKTEFFFMLF